MFFRNLTLFRFSTTLASSLADLDACLAAHTLRPCGPLEIATRGFVSPLGPDSESLSRRIGGDALITLDTRGGWVVMDAASLKPSESVLTALREALGSFPATPLAPTETPRAVLTQWLAHGKLPAGLSLGE